MQQVRKAVRVGKPSWWKTACAVCVLCAATAIAVPAQTFNVLYSFAYQDGYGPSGLTQGTDGSLYGTTFGGGNFWGTVFKITPAGKATTLYNFCPQAGCTDGKNAGAAPIQATDGNFYGTTEYGGLNNYGSIYRITLGGKLATLHSFNNADGANPYAGLVQGSDGNFYGTTEAGGAYGYGTIFRITPDGTLATLHDFDSTDGANAYAGLAQGTDGDFYGTTLYGGTQDSGTVFKITTSGAFAVLHSFCSDPNCSDGTGASSPLIQASDGNFYGTTLDGGVHGAGSVFRISPGGTLTTFHSFDVTDGLNPEGGVIQATDGNFYGTAAYGGANGNGTLFRITPSGAMTVLYSFCVQLGCTDGAVPYAAPMQDTNGNLYGTTFYGGADTDGEIFILSAGLRPFVKTLPIAGKAATAVIILGTKLTGATSVRFNGTAATFTVESPTAIKTAVPTGATTGNVQVVTASGTLSSNVPFRVLP